MSVREYIGARYVPLFADPIEWDNTKTYEPLTIVYYQGNSYTSRQAVPTGIAITNETYWALTGNYNAQIEAYRAEVQEFADDIGDLNAALPLTTYNENNTVEDAIDALDTAIDARFDIIEDDDWVTTARIDDGAVTNAKLAANSVDSSKIADGSIKVADLEKPIFALFGDSWSDFANFQNWYNAAHIGDILNCELKNYAVSGSGFTGGTSQIIQQTTAANSDLTADEKARVKWVVINGGINDVSASGLSAYNTWVVAIREVITAAHNMFPNAMVYFAPNICGLGLNRDKAIWMNYYCYSLLDDLRWGNQVNYVNNLPYFWVGHICDEVFTSDNLHLNATGAAAFGNIILNQIQGTNTDVTRIMTQALTNGGNQTMRGILKPFSIDFSGNGIHFDSGANTVVSTQNAFTEAFEYQQRIKPTPIKVAIQGNGSSPGWIRYNGQYIFTACGSSSGDYYF